MHHLYCIVSAVSGEIFAENLTGRGSAIRWIESRGLTLDHEDSDAEAAESVRCFKECLAEWESKRDVYPQHLVEIEENIARMEANGPPRYVWVKEDSCPSIEFPVRDWWPPIRDSYTNEVLDEGFWFNSSWIRTTAFAD